MRLPTLALPSAFPCLVLAMTLSVHAANSWPQFRGPNGSGIAADDRTGPIAFGPERGRLWRTELPPGHSSPCITGDRIFLTGFDAATKRLEALGLDRADGRILWRHQAPAAPLDKNMHSFSNPAASTPATDGERVYVYFGSYGLLAYDLAGRLVWQRPLPTPPTDYGTASSPIVHEGIVLLQRDGNGPDSELLALDGRTGEIRWRAARPASRESFSTPMIWAQDQAKEIVVVGNARVTAYDFRDGRERWFASGISFLPINVAVAGDGLLFASSAGVGAESEPPYLGTREEIFAQFDQNKDGRLTKDEVPANASFVWRKDAPENMRGNRVTYRWILFDYFEGGKDGVFTAEEWKEVEEFTAKNQNTLMAIRPGGRGNIGATHRPWQAHRGIPDIASPLYYRGNIHLLMDGGRLTIYAAATGKLVLDRERLGVNERFAASPIAGGGHLYAASAEGKIAVLRFADKLEVVARNDLAEPIVATPALVDGRLYVRTTKSLQAFGE